MNAIILYASAKANPDSQPIRIGKSVLWIRVEETNTSSLSDALDIAKPYDNEVVLGCIKRDL